MATSKANKHLRRPDKPQDQSADLAAYREKYYQPGSWYWLRDALTAQGIDPRKLTDEQIYDLGWSGWNDPFGIDWKAKCEAGARQNGVGKWGCSE